MKRKLPKPPYKHIELEKQLSKWYKDRKESGNTTTYKLLCEKANEINDNVGGTSNFDCHSWLRHFMTRHVVQLKFEIYNFCYKELEVELINWLLLEIISERTVLNTILTAETLKLMVEFNGPLTNAARKNWLQKFRQCHNILVEFAMLENRIERYNEINQSNKNLDDQLLNWLLERKTLGDTISLEMLADKALKLMDQLCEKFYGSLKETAEKSWPWRIRQRYNLSMYRRTFEIFQKDDEANQSNVEKIEEEEYLTAESHKLMKLENVKSFDTLQDDIDSDKIPEELTFYANAEAEGHQDTQEQQEDIKNIAENTQRENVPLIVNTMHDINEQPDSLNNLTKLLNICVEAEEHQEQQDDIESMIENIVITTSAIPPADLYAILDDVSGRISPADFSEY